MTNSDSVWTTIRLKKETKHKLAERGRKDQTYDEVILDLLAKRDNHG